MFPDAKPICFEQNNDIIGFEIALLYEFAREKNYSIEFITIENSGDRINYILDKKANITGGALINTEERRKLVSFSYSYLYADTFLVISKEKTKHLGKIYILDNDYNIKLNNTINYNVKIGDIETISSCNFPKNFPFNEYSLINCTISDISNIDPFNNGLILGKSLDILDINNVEFDPVNFLNSNKLIPGRNIIMENNKNEYICYKTVPSIFQITTIPFTTLPITTDPITIAPITTNPIITVPINIEQIATIPYTAFPQTTSLETTSTQTISTQTISTQTISPQTTSPQTTLPQTTVPNKISSSSSIIGLIIVIIGGIVMVIMIIITVILVRKKCNEVPPPPSSKGPDLENNRILIGKLLKELKINIYDKNIMKDSPKCNICKKKFIDNFDRIITLNCGHIFHKEPCFNNYIYKEIEEPKCPNCNIFLLGIENETMANFPISENIPDQTNVTNLTKTNN